MEKNMIGK